VSTPSSAGLRGWLVVGLAVVRRPQLWTTAMRQARRTARPGWWRRAPFLPLPGGPYLRFRVLTQYGDADHPLVVEDVVNYLRWCNAQHGLERSRIGSA
jgi:hypothetical protein